MIVQSRGFSLFEYQADPRFTIVIRPHQLSEMVSFLRRQKLVTFDFETSGTAWWGHAKAAGLAFTSHDLSESQPRNFYVPYGHLTGQFHLPRETVIEAVKPIFEDTAIGKIAHNIKFDEHFLHQEGIQLLGPRHDTMLLAQLYDETRRLGLKFRALMDLGDDTAFLHEELLSYELTRLAKLAGMGKTEYLNQCGYAGIDQFLCGQYACHDALMTWGLFHHYQALGIQTYYAQLYADEMALTEVICEMEEIGLPIDVAYLADLRTRLLKESERNENLFFQAAQVDRFNLGSDEEVRQYLAKGLKLELTKKTKGQQFAVDEEVLSSFLEVRPHLQYMIRWRDVEKKLTTYTQSLIDKADINGIIHPDIKQYGARASGRMSCDSPNVQNVSSDDYDRKKENDGVDPESVKRAFTVPRATGWGAGCSLVRGYFDFSQVEYRVLAFLSQDVALLDAYANGRDIHNEVEKRVWGTEGEHRTKAKTIGFGLSYGLTAPGLARRLKLDIAEAEDIYRRHSEQFPGIQKFKDRLYAEVRANPVGEFHYFNNPFGRTARIKGMMAQNKYDRFRAERQCIAILIQGTAAQLTKILLVRGHRWFKEQGLKTRFVCTVHDEVQTDGPQDEFAYVAPNVKRMAEDFPQFAPVPIVMGGEYSTTHWADKKDIDWDRLQREGAVHG